MQIHEITKRQRTDEGILDKVKNTISAVKTKAVTAGDRWQEKQWDKVQDKRNKEAADAAKILARKGFNVDTTTPAARAQTPTRVKQQQQQKIAQLQQAFDQEFDIHYQVNPDAAEKAAQQKAASTVQPVQPVQPNATTQPYSAQTQQNVKAQNRQMSPRSGIKEGSLAQRAQSRNAGVTQTPAQATPTPSGKKDIAKDFKLWIGQHIPGLENISPEVDAKLDAIFNQMKSAEDPKSIDAAFQQYADLALASVGNAARGQQGQQAQGGGVSASAAYTRDGIAKSLGLEPEALATLQQRITQNKEQISNPNTGSKTIDTLIQAVTKK
jgi:hypothetical protein